MANQTIVAGPWGGTGGNAFDDGFYTGVRAIELSYSDVIGSFSVVYDLNGKPFEGPKHSGTHSFTTVKIELQFPEEYIVSVNGFYSPVSWLATTTPVIRSLTFKTNKRTFGPYGREEGTPFSFQLENGLIVGFKGRTGELLDAIGVHLEVDTKYSGINRNDFPEGFVFGTGTAAYQVEGAAAVGGRGISVWDVFTLNSPGRIADGNNGNIALDTYHRYKDDIKMMKSMGFDAYRFSISWARVIPGGKICLGVNREGIDYYNDLINTCLVNGLQPYVTLFHWDLPYTLEKEYGGFLSKDIVNDFRDFADLCFWEFGDRVKHWTTFNEPWSYCSFGYVDCTFPPGKKTYYIHEKTEGAVAATRSAILNTTHHLSNLSNPLEKIFAEKIHTPSYYLNEESERDIAAVRSAILNTSENLSNLRFNTYIPPPITVLPASCNPLEKISAEKIHTPSYYLNEESERDITAARSAILNTTDHLSNLRFNTYIPPPVTGPLEKISAEKRSLGDTSGKPYMDDFQKQVFIAAKNMCLAHSAAVGLYKRKYKAHQNGEIGITLVTTWFEPLSNSQEDKDAARRAFDSMFGWFLEPVLKGSWPKNMQWYMPDEAEFSEQESKMLIKNKMDFLGVNYYSARYVKNNPPVFPDPKPYEHPYIKYQYMTLLVDNNEGKPIGPAPGVAWIRIVPWGIKSLLNKINELYNNFEYNVPSVYITENGWGDLSDHKLTASKAAPDTTRVKYHRDHLGNILDVIKAGESMEKKLDIKGYFAWSLADNFEWTDGYTVRFGLMYIDYMNHLKRYPKHSAIWFSQFLAGKVQKSFEEGDDEEIQTIVAGPWGGTGGNAFDDGSYTGVRAIELSYRDVIGSFSVVYDLNGKPFEGPKHPGTHSFNTVKIELQFPEEYIVSVNGFYSPVSWLATRTTVIRSLTFKTNKRTFGPYGREEGTPFSFPVENGLIVGFKGRTGELLDAIGFHLALN